MIAGVPWLDLALLGVIAVSVVVGLLRGLVREVFALASWVVSGWVAYRYAPLAAGLFESWLASERLQVIAAAASMFVLGIVVLGLVSTLVAKLIAGIGLKGVDRALGGLFGVARATVIIAGAVLLLQASQLDQSDWWRRSYLVGAFEMPAQVLGMFIDQMVARLPSAAAER